LVGKIADHRAGVVWIGTLTAGFDTQIAESDLQISHMFRAVIQQNKIVLKEFIYRCGSQILFLYESIY